MHADHAINRMCWDEMASSHGQDGYYDSEALVAGASSLIEEEEAALALAMGTELAGRRILHLQCHLGFDAITFARRGAAVSGVDFSTVALEKARVLADRCGVEIEWVCADAIALPRALDDRFDLVWATMGVLCWIADLPAWMEAVANALRAGGRLVLMDGHPLGAVLKVEPHLHVARPYADSRRRYLEAGWDYASTARTGPQVQYFHSLGEIVSAAASAGLCVKYLHEHTELSCDLAVAHLKREPDGRYRRRADGHALPVLFTLVAGTSGRGRF
jgi:SAM-dependent methyltransferase